MQHSPFVIISICPWNWTYCWNVCFY